MTLPCHEYTRGSCRYGEVDISVPTGQRARVALSHLEISAGTLGLSGGLYIDVASPSQTYYACVAS